MSATMMDNPAQQEGRSHRRKIIDSFEINLNRCILCGICVEVCNFDAIEMTHEHELSTYVRNGDRMDLPALLELGKKFQEDTGWIPPTQRGKKDEADEKPDPSTETSAEASTEAKELEQA
jgi:formate hydrogenlyase subunit 6/NADH:ubiquinone oxidoreductase subunit I